MTFRLIPSLEQNPKLVQQAQTPTGKLSLLFLFALPLWLLSTSWREIMGVLLIFAFFSQYRRRILVAAAPALAIWKVDWIPIDSLSRLAAREGIAASFDAVLAARLAAVAALIFFIVAGAPVFRYRKARWLKRPILLWHVLFCALVLAAWALPVSGAVRVGAWAFVFALSGYFWYFCYTVTDRSAKDADSIPLQVGTWRPVWTAGLSSPTPFVKGAAYLRRIEAKSPEELAVTQLKALKLIWWSFLLRVTLLLLEKSLHGGGLFFSIPTFSQAFQDGISGHPDSPLLCWAGLVSAFVESVLTMAVWGHQIVACCRMAGFRALRNTWRPLEARTIADFWNRYYFYFKELLVDLYFYPTFLRYFKRHPRLRRFAATVAAASVGNMLFHFFRDIYLCAEIGLWPAIAGFHVYAIYCLVLGTAIGISQIRSRKLEDAQASWFRRQVWPRFCVGGFYCLLHIFDDTGRTYPITVHFRFLAHLFAFGR
jgi:hypothetical protein